MIIRTIKDTFLNFNLGMLAFVIHRVTGVALALYLILHIYTLSAVLQGEQAFNAALANYDNPIGHALEFLLLVGVAFHTFNGLRVVLVDMFEMTRLHKRLLAIATVLMIIVCVVSVQIFMPGLFG